MNKFNDIFIVDDDLVFHFIIKKLFEKCNLHFNTKYFMNGFEAIEEIKRTNQVPDLILLDINMPVYDGWQFLEEFRKIKNTFDKEVIVYLISSSDDISDINQAMEYKDEVKRYCNKPITMEEFEKIFKET
jgi:two-component system chemotaxis response regulator CheY